MYSVISRTSRWIHIIIMLKLQSVFVQIRKCMQWSEGQTCDLAHIIVICLICMGGNWIWAFPPLLLNLSMVYHLVPKKHWYLKPETHYFGCFPSATPTSTTPLPFLAMEKEHATKVTIIMAQIVQKKSDDGDPQDTDYEGLGGRELLLLWGFTFRTNINKDILAPFKSSRIYIQN